MQNHKRVGAGARKAENLVHFLSNFDPYFATIRRVRKRRKNILKVLEYIAKILKVLKA